MILHKIFYYLPYFVSVRKVANIDSFIYVSKKFFPVKVLEDLKKIKIKMKV